MKILTRDQNEPKTWKEVESTEYSNEKELQKMLVKSPSLIPMKDIWESSSKQLVLAIEEFGFPGSGRTDILSFSADGNVAIIECKLANNPGIKREVIGQILEYGSYLWKMSYDELDDKIYETRRKHLADLVSESVKDDSDWNEEQFRNGVKNSLETGEFSLVIVVDKINEELRKIIEFLNNCGEPKFSFNALEMQRFQAGSAEVLVPQLHGSSSQILRKPSTRWTEPKFFQELQKNCSPDVVSIVKNIYDWSNNIETARVEFGMGSRYGTFNFYPTQNVNLAFTAITDGKLYISYNFEKDIANDFRNLLKNIPQFKHLNHTKQGITVKIADAFLGQPEAFEMFKRAVEKLVETLV